MKNGVGIAIVALLMAGVAHAQPNPEPTGLVRAIRNQLVMALVAERCGLIDGNAGRRIGQAITAAMGKLSAEDQAASRAANARGYELADAAMADRQRSCARMTPALVADLLDLSNGKRGISAYPGP